MINSFLIYKTPLIAVTLLGAVGVFAQPSGSPSAKSQPDTLCLVYQDRLPNYYYWDSNWADVRPSPLYQTNLMFFCGSGVVARHCYTDSTLKLVGLAAAVHRSVVQGRTRDTSMAHSAPEFLQLYEATDTSFDLLASLRYDTIPPAHCMMFPSPGILIPTSLYEVYFDKPITVRDSFYVGGTGNNNVQTRDRDSFVDYFKYPTTDYILVGVVNDSLCCATPPTINANLQCPCPTAIPQRGTTTALLAVGLPYFPSSTPRACISNAPALRVRPPRPCA